MVLDCAGMPTIADDELDIGGLNVRDRTFRYYAHSDLSCVKDLELCTPQPIKPLGEFCNGQSVFDSFVHMHNASSRALAEGGGEGGGGIGCTNYLTRFSFVTEPSLPLGYSIDMSNGQIYRNGYEINQVDKSTLQTYVVIATRPDQKPYTAEVHLQMLPRT